VDPATIEKQVEALGQIFTGALGGMPWEVLGPTAAVAGLVKAKITIEGSGQKSTFRVEGIGEGRGETFKNPVTGEDHFAQVHLPTGFICVAQARVPRQVPLTALLRNDRMA
jgi:hypothetical protein